MKATPGVAVHIEETELLALDDDERGAALDALGAGSDFPFVFVDGVLACTGGLDTSAIRRAVERARR